MRSSVGMKPSRYMRCTGGSMADLLVSFYRNCLTFVGKDVAYTANLGAHTTQLFFNVFVAAIHMVDAVENRFAIRNHRCKYERCRGAQIGTHDGRCRKRCLTAYCSRTPIDFDVRAHADKLLYVHETVLEDVIHHNV